MATVDSLDIKISTEVNEANAEITALSKKLDRLSASLSGVNSRGIATLGAGVNKLANAMSNFLKNVKAEDFDRVANNLKKIGSVKIDTSSVSNASEAIKKVTGAMNGIKDMDFGNNAKQLSSVMRSLSGLGKIEDKSIKSATKAIGKLSGSMLSIKDMDFGENASKLADLAKVLSSLGGKAAGNAVKNIPDLANALNNFMKVMAKAPKVSQNTISMTNALAKFARTGASGGRAAGSLSKSLKSLSLVNLRNIQSLNLSKLTGTISKANIGVKGLFSSFGKLFVAFKSLQGLGSSIKKSMDISSDLTEVQNVVDVTFGNFKDKIEDFSKTSITDFGMSELTAKQMAGRFQAMGTAIGFSQGKMSDMSVDLTKLAGDMASFYNVEQEAVATSLQSVFTGETEPLRKYGLDLTQATLESWAFKQGIDADMQSMSQMEKVMLRYKYVVENTGAARGDFLRTQDSWANQTRILKQNLEALGAVIGGTLINAIKPFVKAMNVALGYVTAFAKTVSNALGKIFGWTYEESGGGLTSDFTGAADGAEDIADSTGTAANNIKKMQAGLRAFDELKVINMPESDSGDSSGGGSGGGIGSAAAGADGKWKESDSIIKKFESEIDSLYKLGEYIGDTLSKAMESIKWEKIYKKAKNFGKGLAKFLNGLISPRLFGNVGKTIANSLNTALHFLDSFGRTFDWKNLGDSLAEGLNSFLGNFDWKLALKNAKIYAKGIASTINNFVENTDFDLIGKTVGNSINTAIEFVLKFGEELKFKNIGNSIGEALNGALKSIKWKKVLKASKTWGKGIAEALNGFISTTDFDEVGETIANSINTVVLGLGTFIRTFNWKKAAEAIADTISSAFKNVNWGEFGRTIASALNAATGTIVTFVKKVKWLEVAKAILNALGGFLKELDYGDLATVILTYFGLKLAKKATISVFKVAAESILRSLDNAIARNRGLANMGKNIVSSIADGIKKYSSKIKQELGKILEEVKKYATKIKGNLDSIAASSTIMNLGVSLQPIEMATHFDEQNKAYEEFIETLTNRSEMLDSIYSGIPLVFDIGEKSIKIHEMMKAINSGIADVANTGQIIDFYGKISGSIVELKNSSKSISESFEETKQKMVAIGSVAEDYYTLSSNYSNLTEEQKRQLKAYSEILSENIEGFSGFVDAGTGAFSGTKEELDNLVKKTQEYYVVLGAKQALEEYGQQLFKLKSEANLLAKELNTQLNTALETNGKTYLEWAAEVKSGTDKELARLLTALENVDYDYGRLDESTKKIYNNQVNTNKTFAEFTERTRNASASLSAARDEEEKINNAMQEGIKIIENNGQGYEENAIAVEKSQSTVKDSVTDTASIVSAQTENASNNMKTNYLDATENAIKTIEDFNKNATEELISISVAGTIGGNNLVSNFGNSISTMPSVASRTMDDLSAVMDRASSGIGTAAGINIGAQMANGIENGIKSKQRELENLVSGVASGMEAVMQAALQIHSPSRVFFKLGEFTIEGFQNGIESMYQNVFSSMKHFGNDLEISPSPYLDKTYTDYQYANSYSEGVLVENTYDYLGKVEEATYRGTMRAIQAAGGIKADVTFQVEGDPNRIFKVTQKEADEFFRRTGRPAYSF